MADAAVRCREHGHGRHRRRSAQYRDAPWLTHSRGPDRCRAGNRRRRRNAGSWDGSLYALSLADGNLEWAVDTGSGISTPPAVVDETVVVGNGAGSLAALDAASGEPSWTIELPAPVRAGPVIADGAVYIQSHDDYVHATDIAD
ncbi:outer membrane protein assembly factor BamB family protein [Natrinema pallidum]